MQEELEMIINKTLENGKITFALDGRLDTTTSSQLQDVLIPAFNETNEVELDCTQLAYVSSAGLRVLLSGLKTAKAKGASMTVINISQEIMEVLEMTGFTDMLTIA
jgi:anti-anti-sigma factor